MKDYLIFYLFIFYILNLMQRSVPIREGKPDEVHFMHCITATPPEQVSTRGSCFSIIGNLELLLQKQPPETVR